MSYPFYSYLLIFSFLSFLFTVPSVSGTFFNLFLPFFISFLRMHFFLIFLSLSAFHVFHCLFSLPYLFSIFFSVFSIPTHLLPHPFFFSFSVFHVHLFPFPYSVRPIRSSHSPQSPQYWPYPLLSPPPVFYSSPHSFTPHLATFLLSLAYHPPSLHPSLPASLPNSFTS